LPSPAGNAAAATTAAAVGRAWAPASPLAPVGLGRASLGLGEDGKSGPGAASAIAAAATFVSLLVAAGRRGTRRGRVALGPTGGCWYEYKFRAKPGDKFKYRFSTDVYTPEFGYYPPEAKGRFIKFGLLIRKGEPIGKAHYLAMKAAEEGASGQGEEEALGALLLDCDGTLVETERDGHRVAFNQAFKEKGFDCEWEVGLYGELLTTGGGKERMTRYFTDYNPDAWPHEDPPAKDHPAIVELHALKTKLFMEIVRAGKLPLREGVEELLSKATAAGWKIAVCSTSNEDSVTAVVQTMLPKYASSMRIFAGDMVKAKKPDPAIYTMAAQALDIAPIKCVVVEDTNIGMKAGKAAGMSVIVTKSIYSEDEDFGTADLVVTSAAEVDFKDDVVSLLPVLELA